MFIDPYDNPNPIRRTIKVNQLPWTDKQKEIFKIALNHDTKIVFEGTTDDAYETTLTVTDPTADRTITLPNVTGTVVTTGDTGTITATMLAANSVDSSELVDGSIDASHISTGAVTGVKLAADAVDGSKLADNAVDSEIFLPNSNCESK